MERLTGSRKSSTRDWVGSRGRTNIYSHRMQCGRAIHTILLHPEEMKDICQAEKNFTSNSCVCHESSVRVVMDLCLSDTWWTRERQKQSNMPHQSACCWVLHAVHVEGLDQGVDRLMLDSASFIGSKSGAVAFGLPVVQGRGGGQSFGAVSPQV